MLADITFCHFLVKVRHSKCANPDQERNENVLQREEIVVSLRY